MVAVLPTPADRPALPAQPRRRARGVGADPAGPLAALVFKTLSDPFTGKISILRVVSGTLSSDSTPGTSRAEEQERSAT
jgi:elongation factor G